MTIKEQNAAYYVANKEQILAKNCEYRVANKEQIAAKKRDYYIENKEQISAKQRDYNEENKEQRAAYHREYIQRSDKNFIIKLLSAACRYDKRHNYITDIDINYVLELLIKQNGRCAVTDILMTRKIGDLLALSIDRIDSSKGHIKGNIQLVCRFYNLGKGKAADSDGRKVIKQINGNDVQEWQTKCNWVFKAA